MKLYLIDDGANYWLAAKNMRQAWDIMWRNFEQNEVLEEVEDNGSISVDLVPEARARNIRIQDDGGLDDEATQDLWTVFQGMTEPGIIACSEW